MSHLDDGLLTALVDNELEPDARRRVEAHLGACPDCRRLLDEIRVMATEADGLVASLDLPAPASAPGLSAPVERRSGGNPEPRPLRRWRSLAWAASIAVAVGLGWMASDMRYREVATAPPTPQRESDGAAQAAPAPATIPGEAKTVPTAGGPAPAAAPVATVKPAGEVAHRVQEPRAASPVPASPPGVESGAATGGLNAPAAALAERRDARALQSNQLTLDQTSTAAKQAEPPPSFQRGTMEEAVRVLGGSIRLLDGLEPARVLLGSGGTAPLVDSSANLVRIVYEDPPGRELWLDQQRSRRLASGELRPPREVLQGDTLEEPAEGGRRRVVWIDQHGFLVALTGFLTADSLRAMIARVH